MTFIASTRGMCGMARVSLLGAFILSAFAQSGGTQPLEAQPPAAQTAATDDAVYAAVLLDLSDSHADASIHLDPRIATAVEATEGSPPWARFTEGRLDDRTVEALLAATPARECRATSDSSRPCNGDADGVAVAFSESDAQGSGIFEVMALVAIPRGASAATPTGTATEIWSYSVEVTDADTPARVVDKRRIVRTQ